jgi:hypothetical protein
LSAAIVVSGISVPVYSEVLHSSLAEDEYEQRHEGEVDEVGRFGQTDGQEEDRHEAALGLRLTSDALDRCATGKTITDGRTDRAATEGESASDECSGSLDCTVDAAR